LCKKNKKTLRKPNNLAKNQKNLKKIKEFGEKQKTLRKPKNLAKNQKNIKKINVFKIKTLKPTNCNLYSEKVSSFPPTHP